MSEALRRRLERLERAAPSLVLVWKGEASEDEALRQRFGAAGAPRDAQVVFLTWADGTG